MRRGLYCVPSLAGVALALVAPSPAVADVTRSGDVAPAFTPGAVVDLSGQRVYIGGGSGTTDLTGTVSVTGGATLTAAQIFTGYGDLKTGFFSVSGAGSTLNLTGGAAYNGFDIGSWGTGIVTIADGGRVNCASVAACSFASIGNAAGSTGTLAINGGSITGFGQLAVGQGALSTGFGTPGANTSGTLSITNGGTLSSFGYSVVANNSGQAGQVTGNVTIDGTGSKWLISRDLVNGGSQAGLGLASAANTTANVVISNGGNLTITGSRSTPATDNSLPLLNMSTSAGARSTMTVTSGGSVRFAGDSGALNVGGNTISAGGSATLSITAGGTVAGTGANGLNHVDIGRNSGTGTVNIDGAGSQLSVGGVGGQNTQGLDGLGALVRVGGAGNLGSGNGTLNVSNGGSLRVSDNGQAASTGIMGLRVASGVGGSGVVNLTGAGSSIVIASTGGSATTPAFVVGSGGTARMTLGDRATVSLSGSGERDFTVNSTATGSGTLTMSAGATINASRFAVADNGGAGTATIDASTVNLDGVINFNGGLVGAGVRVGRGDGAVGVLTLQNGAVININNSVASASVILGGTSALSGGTGTLNMTGGSAINFTGTAASASLGVGGTDGTGFMTMAGASTVNVVATGSATVGGSAGSNGTLTVGGGSSITANVIGIGGNSDTAAGGNGSATVTGAGSALLASGGTGLLTIGRQGTGSLTVNDSGALSATSLSVGRGAAGLGTLRVDHSVVTLSGQQTVANSLSGANLSVGIAGGTGAATIADGSVVSITNLGSLGASLNVGGRPDTPGALGNGVLTVADSQVNVVAAPGLATVRVGYDGNGTARFTNSTLNIGNPAALGADGRLIVAGQPGSTGTLALNGSVVNTGYVGVGASPSGPGGTGTLTLNNSTINTTTFEIGVHGLLNGDNGVINASGNVTVAGTISPGNSPGRININCNLIALPGSRLILDVLGNGTTFNVDHLILGNDATFDLSHLQVVFNFLGNTDPNSFAASGGFDLDNFLESLDLQTGEVSGLSSRFAAGETWRDVLDISDVTARSSVYDLSDLRVNPDGVVTLVAVPVPEPSTWALLAFGVLTFSVAVKRRPVTRRI